MSWAEDRAEALENYTEASADAWDYHVHYGGSSYEDAETMQYHLEVQRLRAERERLRRAAPPV